MHTWCTANGGGGGAGASFSHRACPAPVSDWDHFERLFTHGFSSVLSTVPDKHPLIVTEPSFNDRTKRAKYGELMFETLNAPAAFLAKDAVLSWHVRRRTFHLGVAPLTGRTPRHRPAATPTGGSLAWWWTWAPGSSAARRCKRAL